jgi:hypothetical protein
VAYTEKDALRDVGLGDYNDYNDYNDSRVLPVAEEFPIDSMPASCKRLIREASESIGCPPEFVAVPMLCVLGSAIGNSRTLELKSGWEQKAVIFAAIIGSPGSKKSPAISVATKPVGDLQLELRNRYREKREDYERQMREHDKDVRECRKDGVSAPRQPEAPAMESVVVDDTTVEAVGRILKESPRGILVEKDELSGWLKGMDQYKASGKGSDRSFWLSAWISKNIRVDRKSQPEPVVIPDPFISIIGGIQPQVLKDLDQAPEDGMLDRFLVSYPDAVLPGWRDAEISESAEIQYAGLYQQLRIKHMQRDDHDDPEPLSVYFSTTAKTVLIDLVNEHALEQMRPGFPPMLEGVYAKLESYIGRLCLTLAMARSVDERTPERVEVHDVVAVAALIRYFKSMARRVYAAIRESNPLDSLAEDVTRFLEASGGMWKGEPSELYLQLQTPEKPKRVNEFSKMLKAAVERQPSMSYANEVENYTKEDGSRSTRRVITLKLL